MSDKYVIKGARLRCLIVNAHQLLRAKYRNTPLWAMVSDLTSHGSTVSSEICVECGFKPDQNCGVKKLEALP